MKWTSAAISACTLATNQSTARAECPCFKMNDLRRIPPEEIDTRRSCAPQHGGWSLWRDPIQRLDHHGFGFAVRVGTGTDTSTCLTQGDIMMQVSSEEAMACEALIKQRCVELGFIQP